MTDQDFQNMILTALGEIKEQSKERYDRLEKQLDTIEAQRKTDNERLEKRLDTTNERLEKRLDAIETHVGQLKHDVGWIKGKLEGKQEGSGRMLTVFTTGAAIAAVIIAMIALFN
ncbi:hypothetical protein F4Y59_14610 [Candidatus Poribacteria bacterium]|nr:hypothetical protein [Candidatus Poribacteria bacterium]MYK18723.1 hypothetical protein [Candidatus Poribacteria bacterium]